MSRIWSAVLVHTNGFGSLFHSLIQRRMSASSSVTLRWAERRSLRLVSSANHRDRARCWLRSASRARTSTERRSIAGSGIPPASKPGAVAAASLQLAGRAHQVRGARRADQRRGDPPAARTACAAGPHCDHRPAEKCTAPQVRSDRAA